MSGGEVVQFVIHKEIDLVLSILNHRAVNTHVALQVSVPDSLTLTGDPIKFNQLIANLALNAIEAYDDPTVSTTRTVKITVRPYRSGISVAINDHGKGLTKQERSRMFEAFYTSKSKTNRNMGLGLSLVKQFVEQDFSGRLTVNSTPKAGTTFTAYLFNQKHA